MGRIPERSGWVSQGTTDCDYDYHYRSPWIIDFALFFLPRIPLVCPSADQHCFLLGLFSIDMTFMSMMSSSLTRHIEATYSLHRILTLLYTTWFQDSKRLGFPV